MPSRPQVSRRRPVPCAVVLCGGLLAGVMLPGTAHAAGVGSHRRISSQIIGGSRDDRGSTSDAGNHRQISGGSRDHRGFTVSPTRTTMAALRVRNAG